MKQLKAILCSIPLMLAAIGCSQDKLTDTVAGGYGEQARPVEITFHIGTDADIQTRSAVQRPVISSDNWQRVTDVRIYAFVSETGGEDDSYRFAPGVFNYDGGTGKDYFYVSKYAEKKKDWKDDDVWGDETASEDKSEQYTLENIKAYLKSGKHYKFLAIGRDDICKDDTYINKENELRGEWNIPKWNESTTLATASLTCTGGIACPEMFSGCSEDIHVTKYGEYSAHIELKRIVAGMMLYVKNVPAKIAPLPESGVKPKKGKTTVDVHRISICPIQYIEEVLVAQNMNAGTERPGHGKPAGEAYVKNWHNKRNNSDFDYAFDKEYVSIDTKEYNDYPIDGIKGKDGYFNAEKGHKLLAGNFVLPQDDKYLTAINENSEIDKSLYLVFWTNRGDGQIMNAKSTQPKDPINISRWDKYIPIYWIPIKLNNTGKDKFPILGNHFYSLGLYNEAEGKDNPLDLSKYDYKKGTESIVPALHAITPEEAWPVLPIP